MSINFKVGDKVRIVKKVEDCGYLDFGEDSGGDFALLSWVDHMDKLVGKTGSVTFIEYHECPAIGVACEGECAWWFSAESLQLEK